MIYLVKTPRILQKIFPEYLWRIPASEKTIFLTFDDGPHPVVTPFVLRQLKQNQALATFFCIGKNVVNYPDIYQQILDEGHTTGNHTFHHLNGWKTKDEEYLKDIAEASRYINSPYFRPPYGRITRFQAKNLKPAMKGKDPVLVMWDVLSGDFDERITAQQCLANVVLGTTSGSVIVFHDSEKAFRKLEYTLPRVLHYFSEKGYQFKSL